MPTVNAQTGGVSNGSLKVGTTFQWTSGNGVACTVSAPSGSSNAWFTTNPVTTPPTISVPATGNSAHVTAAKESPVGSSGWPYLVNGNTPAGNPKVPVDPAR
jgi:hypothetical protein